MRACRKNQKKMKYVTQVMPENVIYVTDEEGDVVYDISENEYEPRIEHNSDMIKYSEVMDLRGNIHSSGGQAEATSYGISVSDYDAVLYLQKNSANLDETSLIWVDNEPTYLDDKQSVVDPASADYQVIRVPPRLDENVYLLKRVDK